MRTQAGQVQPLAPVRGVQAVLPDFQPGQTFSARIQEVLPDNTYRALVAGRQLTLQLPEGATAGDTLELTVVDRTPSLLVARRASGEAPPAAAEAPPYPYSKISAAGREIGRLLVADGESPPPAPLNRGQPLLATGPNSGAELAPLLQKAVSQSGLFYEAHQAQWFAGARPLTSLRAEPQGQLPVVPAHGEAAKTAVGGNEKAATQFVALQPNQTAERTPEAGARSDTTGSPLQQSSQSAVPESIRAIVQQQLDAVATQRLAWHGEVWPGQSAEWTIQRDITEEQRSRAEEEQTASGWSTSLRLTMPRLGTIDAVLRLSAEHISISVAAGSASTNALKTQVPELTEAINALGLSIQSLDIRSED